jgi:hypothetical protein
VIRGFTTLCRLSDIASAVILGGVITGVVLSVSAGVVAIKAIDNAMKWVRR